MEKMDTFFIPHAMARRSVEKTPSRGFLKSWKENVKLCIPPKAILIVSAHWDTTHPTVNVVHHNETMYDFVNFPPFMSKLKYPAPGAPELAMRVKHLLLNSGINTVDEDRTRGLDHGAWFPLMLMYPDADIPVCELSVQSSMDGLHHYNIGKALAPLREEGILIIGSGGATNNVQADSLDDGPIEGWALDFVEWLTNSLLDGRHEDVIHVERAPNAKLAHAEPDHYYPLLVALGAAESGAKAQLLHDSWRSPCLSFAAYRFSSV